MSSARCGEQWHCARPRPGPALAQEALFLSTFRRSGQFVVQGTTHDLPGDDPSLAMVRARRGSGAGIPRPGPHEPSFSQRSRRTSLNSTPCSLTSFNRLCLAFRQLLPPSWPWRPSQPLRSRTAWPAPDLALVPSKTLLSCPGHVADPLSGHRLYVHNHNPHAGCVVLAISRVTR